jgi:hypothetical protein
MAIFSKLFGKPEVKDINIEETIREAFRSGESVDGSERRKSIQLYAEIVHKDPANHLAYFNLGVIQSRLGDRSAAIHSFAQAQSDGELELVASYAKLKLMVESGQQPSDADFPPEFHGDNRGALGVQGPCHNAANELRNRGYTCTLEAKGESCSIHCHNANGEYIIAVNDLLGMLMKNVYRKEGDKKVNLSDVAGLSETEREIKTLDIGPLPLAQAPVSKNPDIAHYRAAKEIAGRKVGQHGWVRAGRSFDEITAEKAADAKKVGMEFIQINSIEDIARANRVAGTFLACCLNGEPHAVAMPDNIAPDSIPTIKRAVEGGACIFRAEFFTQPQYPLVHIGLGLPARYLEGSKVAFIVIENVANFVEANFQEWVGAIEAKRYTNIHVVPTDGHPIASGRTNLDPKVISEIVECVNKANNYFKTIPQASQNYMTALNKFYEEYPEPFIWSPKAPPMR